MYQSISKELLSVQVFMCQSWCESNASAAHACQRVRFSSFPPHLPQAHCPLLSHLVSPEKTYVSGSSKCRAGWWTQGQCTPACIQARTHTDMQSLLVGDWQQCPVEIEKRELSTDKRNSWSIIWSCIHLATLVSSHLAPIRSVCLLFRVGGHDGGAAIPGFQADLPPAVILMAKLESLLFHQRPGSMTFVL